MHQQLLRIVINIIDYIRLRSLMMKLLFKLFVILEVKFNSNFRWAIFNSDVYRFYHFGVVKSIELMSYGFSRRFQQFKIAKISRQTWTLFHRCLIKHLQFPKSFILKLHIARRQTLIWRWHINKCRRWLKLLLSYKFINLVFIFHSLTNFSFWHCFILNL